MNIQILLLLLIFNLAANSQEKNIEIQEYKFITDSIFSKSLEGFKTVKIFLPQNYSKNEKYPVIYTMDADWMFEPTSLQSKILMDFDVIPPSIVVGVFHKNRNNDIGIDWKTGDFSLSSSKFYDFLTKDLINKINESYQTSGFNVLLGHSNSATFCEEVLTQKNQPFNGFVALSQNLFGNQLNELIEFSNSRLEKPIFYFVASGKRDATPRLKTGFKIDSIFKSNTNKIIFFKHKLYDADHNGIVGQALTNGITHIFSAYKHYNDWDEKLIDSLEVNNISPMDFIKEHSKNMKNIYGINFKPNQNDFSLMHAMSKSDKDIEAIMQYEIKQIGISKDFYATYAQYYEYAKSYEKALEFWNKNLEMSQIKDLTFFYYRRPLQLLYERMKQPKRAIDYAKLVMNNHPKLRQDFNWWIAKIVAESKIEKQTGIDAIKNYINNYTNESPIDLKTAKKMLQTLKEL
ncbi:MAG: hypothetical protein KDD03_08855 [Gelidibacter sp.]|nr:hypothetical protein [Gelidibacter sp.]